MRIEERTPGRPAWMVELMKLRLARWDKTKRLDRALGRTIGLSRACQRQAQEVSRFKIITQALTITSWRHEAFKDKCFEQRMNRAGYGHQEALLADLVRRLEIAYARWKYILVDG